MTVHVCRCGKEYQDTCEGRWVHRLLLGHTPTREGTWRSE